MNFYNLIVWLALISSICFYGKSLKFPKLRVTKNSVKIKRIVFCTNVVQSSNTAVPTPDATYFETKFYSSTFFVKLCFYFPALHKLD